MTRPPAAGLSALPWARLLPLVAVFAVAMAYVEAAVVVYLRELWGITDPLQVVPTEPGWLIGVEAGREVATLVMLVAFAWVAGRQPASRVGVFLVAFGLWDLAYYAWLWLLVRWPSSLGDWDLLFLLPLPWWAPVGAPVMVAALFVGVGAALVAGSAAGRRQRIDRISAALGVAGVLVMLGTFMASGVARIPDGMREAAEARPDVFAWPVFLAGWLLLAGACLRVLRTPRLPV